MTHDVTIRCLEDNDIDFLHGLMEEFVSSHSSIRYRNNYWTLLRDWLFRIKSEEDFRALVAKLDTKIIGFAVAQIKDNDPLLLPEKVGFGHIMVVAKEHQKKGVGKALWSAIQDWFMSRGIEQAETFTLIRNGVAEDFWESHGFVPFWQKRICRLKQ